MNLQRWIMCRPDEDPSIQSSNFIRLKFDAIVSDRYSNRSQDRSLLFKGNPWNDNSNTAMYLCVCNWFKIQILLFYDDFYRFHRSRYPHKRTEISISMFVILSGTGTFTPKQVHKFITLLDSRKPQIMCNHLDCYVYPKAYLVLRPTRAIWLRDSWNIPTRMIKNNNNVMLFAKEVESIRE